MQIPLISSWKHVAYNLFQIPSAVVFRIEGLEQCADGMNAGRVLDTGSLGRAAVVESTPYSLERQRELQSGFGLMAVWAQVVEWNASDENVVIALTTVY